MLRERSGERCDWGDARGCAEAARPLEMWCAPCLRAELEAMKNERDLAVLSLAALTPHNPNEGTNA